MSSTKLRLAYATHFSDTGRIVSTRLAASSLRRAKASAPDKVVSLADSISS